MNATRAEVKLLVAEVLRQVAQKSKPEARLALSDFSEALSGSIRAALKRLGEPTYFINGNEYSSMFAITRALGWKYKVRSWVKLHDYITFRGLGAATKHHWLETDSGPVYLAKGGQRETVSIKLSDVESVLLVAWPRGAKKLITTFKEKHGVKSNGGTRPKR